MVKSCARDKKNHHAWSEFVSRFDETIRRGIFRFKNLLVNHKDSEFRYKIMEDLIQDVYHQLLKNDCKALKDFRGKNENSFYLYLTIICKNTTLNYLKSKGSHEDRTPDHEGEKDEPGTVDTPGEQIDLLACINLFSTGKNKERDRLILKLYFLENYLPEEIANILPGDLSPKRIANLISEFKNYIKNSQILSN
ncbi:sigma-70 family RNA polymerase sigma factor [candidate division KSB1 bacterium]|nr:sigma-70 family RNA polymerase sigma factor [candidate division KSB1 bacterium]